MAKTKKRPTRQILEHFTNLRPPLIHGGLSPDVVYVARDRSSVKVGDTDVAAQEARGVQQGEWRVWVHGFAEGVRVAYAVLNAQCSRFV